MQKVKEYIKNKKDKGLGLKDEFIYFLREYKVIGLAIGIVMGNAVSKFVTSLVNDIIMPLINLFTPQGDWREWSIYYQNVQFKMGNLVGSILDFTIIALVIFFFVKIILKKEKVEKI